MVYLQGVLHEPMAAGGDAVHRAQAQLRMVRIMGELREAVHAVREALRGDRAEQLGGGRLQRAQALLRHLCRPWDICSSGLGFQV